MADLGHLVWWRVSDARLPHALAQSLLPQLGLEVPPPHRVAPIDAFRRLTSEVSEQYTSGGDDFVLRLHVVEREDGAMLVRHIVRHNRTTNQYAKVGEAVFYKPPKGQPSKSRMRINVHSQDPAVAAFAQRVRETYDRALLNLDAQAVRRVIRSHLTAVGALSLSGPYFFEKDAHVTPLQALFVHLGPGSVIYRMAVEDTDVNRLMLDAARRRRE